MRLHAFANLKTHFAVAVATGKKDILQLQILACFIQKIKKVTKLNKCFLFLLTLQLCMV